MRLPEGIRLRAARRGDRDAIYTLLAPLGVSISSADQSNTLSWIVSHPECEVLVAVDPMDRPVGFLSFSHHPQLSAGGRIGVIDECVVAEPMRRRGIASALLHRALSRARILGCKRVQITAREPATREFLRRRGFAIAGREVMERAPEQ